MLLVQLIDMTVVGIVDKRYMQRIESGAALGRETGRELLHLRNEGRGGEESWRLA